MNKPNHSQILKNLRIPIHVIMGTENDNFKMECPADPKLGLENLKKSSNDLSYTLLKGATHGLAGYEDKVAEEVYNFVIK